MRIRSVITSAVCLTVLAVPAVVLAQDTGGGDNPVDGEFTNPLNVHSIQDLIASILEIVAMIALPFIVLAFVYTGFLFVKAQGNKDELETAKKALLYTTIGALVILGAQVLADAISGTVDRLEGNASQAPVISYEANP